MEIVFKKKRQNSINDKITVPMPFDMKQKVEQLKNSHHLDINEMVRGYLEQVILKVERGEYQQNAG